MNVAANLLLLYLFHLKVQTNKRINYTPQVGVNNLSESSFQDNSSKESEEINKRQRYSDGYLIYQCLTCILSSRINEELELCSKIYGQRRTSF